MRYAKYKPTNIPWLPEVPETWEKLRTKDVLIANDGGVWGTDPDPNNEGTIVLRSTEQTVDGKLKIDNPARRVLSEVEHTKALLRAGDLIITKSSGSQEHIGKTSVIDAKVAELNCCYSNFLQRLRVKGNPKYFWYLYNSQFVKNQFDLMTTTTTGLKNLNGRILGNVQFACPPLFEQRAIAEYLDEKCAKIDTLVTAKTKQIELFKELRQSIIAEAVTKGIDGCKTFKPTNIPWLPEVPETWEVRPLRHFLTTVSKKGFQDKQLLSVTRESGVIVRDIESKESNHNFIPDDLSNYKLVEKGDFAVNKMKSWQGSYGVSEYDGIVSPAYFVFKLRNVYSKFFSIAIRSKAYISFFARFSKGIRVDQWDLSLVAIKEIPFLLPPLAEQKRIVAYLDKKCAKIDTLVAKIEDEVIKLKEYRERLVADVVTGQRKVVK